MEEDGFSKEMTESLIVKKKALKCSGKIYSKQHRRNFEIKDDILRVGKSSVDDNKLVLTNKQLIGEWFKGQFDKLLQSLRRPTEEPRKK